MTNETRNPHEMCLHAHREFAFLEHAGYQSSCEVSRSSFTLTFTSEIHPVTISVGAFLPRYEYGVSIACLDQHLDLDEAASVLESLPDESPRWTWAHSDAAVFRNHISYSANLLQRHLTQLTQTFSEVYDLVASKRRGGKG